MSFLEEKFRNLDQRRQKALIPYVTAGFPAKSKTMEIVRTLVGAGADILELGFPFSDPIADGPVIQECSFRALASGVTVRDGLSMVERVSSLLPVVPMTYCNLVYRYGVEAFARDLSNAGACGLILADLSLEASSLFQAPLSEQGIDLIRFVSTTTPPERARKIIASASGFIYCVSRPGTTGVRSELYSGVISYLQKIQAMSPIPLCVGFGLSRASHIRKLLPYASGFIVGSCLLAPYLKLSFRKALSEMEKLVTTMKKATYGKLQASG